MSQSLENAITPNPNVVTVHKDEYLMEQLIRQVHAGHESAACQLREFLARGVQWYLSRNAPEISIEVDAQRILDSVIRAVKEGRVANQGELMSLVRTCARSFASHDPNLRRSAPPVNRWDVERMKLALYELSPQDRDALVRYFQGQSPERICSELGISDQALHSLRSRLRARYAELNSAS